MEAVFLCQDLAKYMGSPRMSQGAKNLAMVKGQRKPGQNLKQDLNLYLGQDLGLGPPQLLTYQHQESIGLGQVLEIMLKKTVAIALQKCP